MKTFRQFLTEAGLHHPEYNPTGEDFHQNTPGEVAADAAEENNYSKFDVLAYFRLLQLRLMHFNDEINTVRQEVMNRISWDQWERGPDNLVSTRVQSLVKHIYDNFIKMYTTLNSKRSKIQNNPQDPGVKIHDILTKFYQQFISDYSKLMKFLPTQKLSPELTKLNFEISGTMQTLRVDLESFIRRYGATI